MAISANFISNIDTITLKYISVVEIMLSDRTIYYSTRSLTDTTPDCLPYLSRHPSVSGSKVDIREVSSSIGNASFILLDKDAAVTLDMVDETYLNKTVNIYLYFDSGSNVFPTDALKVFTGKIDTFTSDNIELTFSAREIIFEASKSIFDAQNNLNGALNNSDTTITVKSTTDFPTSAAFKIDDEIITYSGKTATTFTGCTRGTNGSTAATHDDDAEVLEVWVSGSVNPITLALQLLMSIAGDGSNDATYDVIREGIGLDPDDIDITSFTTVRDANSFGTYSFIIGGGIRDTLKFIESELLAPTITRMITSKDSFLTLIQLDQSEFTSSTESITSDHIIDKAKLKVTSREIVNNVVVEYKWDEASEEYEELSSSTDTTSIATYGSIPSSKKKFSFKGMNTSVQADRFISDYLERNSTPVPRVTFSTFLKKRLLEPGDDIRLEIKNTPNLEAGNRNFNHLVEILSVSQSGPVVNFEAAFTRFSVGRASFISPSRGITSKTSETIFTLSAAGSGDLFSEGMTVALYDSTIGSNFHFYSNFDTDLDAKFSGFSNTALLRGSPSMSGGFLVLTGDVNSSVGYEGENCHLKNTGAIRLKVKPNYSGSPGTNQYFFSAGPMSGMPNNTINIYHNSSGNLVTEVYDSSGIIIVSISAAWSPTSGNTYELEFNMDIGDGWQFDTGASRMFVDGVQHGSTNSSIMSKHAGTLRSRFVEYINLGTDRTHSYSANHSISEIIIFKAIQHTSGYTPSSFVFTDPRDYRTITDITGDVITIDSAFDITINTSIHYMRFSDYDQSADENKFWAYVSNSNDGFSYDDSGSYVIKG